MNVRLKHKLIRVDGPAFPAGTVLKVSRKFMAGGVKRYALANEAGEIVLPCVDPADVERVAYNRDQVKYEPTAAEILAACAEFQAGWDEDEEAKRRGCRPRPVEIQQVQIGE